MKKDTPKQKEARATLRKLCRPGTTIYTIIRHVSKSGMTRRIDLFVIRKNRPWRLSHYVADLEGYRVHRDGGITVQGCGMDMGFHLVHNLSYALHGHKETARVDHPGYSLKHEWI